MIEMHYYEWENLSFNQRVSIEFIITTTRYDKALRKNGKFHNELGPSLIDEYRWEILLFKWQKIWIK